MFGMSKEKRLSVAIGLSLIFFTVEVIGGIWSNSLAILTDASHLLTDIAGFAIALIATIVAKREADDKYTYGLVRAEVMGALFSVITLWIITAILLYEAYFRAMAWFEGHPPVVRGKLMSIIALFGVCVNICLATVFHEDHGGAFHSHDHAHGDAHDHGHSHGHHEEKKSQGYGAVEDIEHGHLHDSAHKHDEGHDHDAGHGHDSGHEHGACGGHDSSHDHDSGHDHSSGNDHGHDSDHGHGGCNDHDDHSHGSHEGENLLNEEKFHSAAGDVNLEAAYLHVLTDLAQSVGVAIAGFVIWWHPTWQIVDPLCTLLFSCFVVWSTFDLIGRVTAILFEGVPAHVDWKKVKQSLLDIPGVTDVHDLHIWSISSSSVSLTCHMRAKNPQQALKKALKVLRDMKIDHVTIQIQDDNDENCVSAPYQGDCHN